MANPTKSVTGINYGQPGRLIYVPRKDSASGVGELHSSRLSDQPPSFGIIGNTAELYPPSKVPLVPSSLKPSHERQLQKQWLYDVHPEACPGLGAIGDLLADELTSAVRLASAASTRCLLDMGPITDVSNSSQRTGTPAIAMAAGEAGEKLRIAKVNESRWAWGSVNQKNGEETISEGVQLELAIIDPDSWQDECLWTNDGLPFTQIKFATHSAPNEPIRWLLAQKATSTSILSPEYHKVPVGDINVEALDFHMPSKIDPQHELTITHHQTGGRAHCDVAFNPPTQGSAAQVVIMDECGYWTIWAIIGRTRVDKSQEKRAILRKHGHVFEGILPDISFSNHHPSQPHGALFIGVAEGAEFQSSLSETGSTTRAPYVLVWNPDKFEVVDFEDGTLLQPFKLPTRSSSRPNTILDVQLSPVTQSHTFVLTSQSLHWIDLPRHGMASKPTLILECPHLPATNDVRMSICRVSDDENGVMVFLYSPGGTHFTVNWLRLSEDPELPQWHRQVLPMVQNPAIGKSPHAKNPDMMLFHSAKLFVVDEPTEPSLGEPFVKEGVLFFQGLLLSEDLSLRYCIGNSHTNPGLSVSLPTIRLNWTPKDKERSWKRQQKLFLKRIGGAFVLPDGLEPDDVVFQDQQADAGQPLKKHGPDEAGQNLLNIRRIVEVLGQCIEVEDGHRGPLLPASSVDVLESMLESGIAEASVPLFTWQDVMSLSRESSEWTEAQDVEARLHDLKKKVEDEVSMPELRLRSSNEAQEESITTEAIHNELSSLCGYRQSESSDAQQQQPPHIAVAKLVSDCFLSTQGFVIQDVPLFRSAGEDASEEHLERGRVPPSQIPRSSQSPGRIRSSSPASVLPPEKLQAQFRRLQLLAPSLVPGSLSTKQPPKVLSYWPTSSSGESLANYVSSVATESDSKFDDMRQRLQRAEARKKAQAEKLRRPIFARQGLPTEEDRAPRVHTQVDAFRSSPQPAAKMTMSSQSHGPSQAGGFGSLVTMSQPTAGAFGDRKKVKKTTVKKKRSGFR
ncbi:hypothetical protein NLU13_7035 [Sarocladium strictum]|uniref:RNA polymerase I-specific transcription initiation factor RRN6-like protein n=1 Tax=Sarocladium strictum TaxID=5046 RepID=A0AA39GFS1_SARSR|nr:hypothetical protein NLU13_7035 [Sarocladium strictum]